VKGVGEWNQESRVPYYRHAAVFPRRMVDGWHSTNHEYPFLSLEKLTHRKGEGCATRVVEVSVYRRCG